MSPVEVVRERMRSRLWPLPALATVLAVLLALGLARIRAPAEGRWVADGASARALLQVLAGSSLTVVALVFSLQVVALQLAASQYSPRLLRTYARDLVIQSALAVLIGTFAFSLVTLALFGSGPGTPSVSISVAVILGIACVAALVGVVSHIVTSLRVETMMAGLHEDAQRVIDPWLARERVGPRESGHLDEQPPSGQSDAELLAASSGFVQAVDADRLARSSAEAGFRLRVDVVPGEQVMAGQVLARAWGVGQSTLETSGCSSAIIVGFERSPDQDPALGLVQLVDITLRALSPSLNDPTTARHALGHVTDLLIEASARCHGSDLLTRDSRGTPRVWQASRSLADFLAMTCRPVVRSAATDPDTLTSVIRLLAEVRDAVDESGRHMIDPELDYLQRFAQRGLEDPEDLERILSALSGVRGSAPGN